MELVTRVRLAWIKSLFLFLALFAMVVLVNLPVLRFDMLYFEQPILYLVNQTIHSPADLLHMYLHPAVLDAVSVPFFRPSGHYLAYQFLTTFLDWHNTRGFLIVNLFFLACSCWVMLRLYTHLFPGYRVGGFIACGVYLMHPALMLSRLSPMHFEFASVFFALLALLCCMRFCQQNPPAPTQPLRKMGWLLASVGCYFFSVTFKETTIMMGPVMMLFVALHFLPMGSAKHALKQVIVSKQIMMALALLMIVTVTCTTYLSLAWPTATHPISILHVIRSTPELLWRFGKIFFGLPTVSIDDPAHLQWDVILLTPLAKILLLGLVACFCWAAYTLFSARWKPKNKVFLVQKSWCFLVLAALLFLVLPILWGRARPWHLALSLPFTGLVLGWSFECCCQQFFRRAAGVTLAALLLGVLFCFTTFTVMQRNISDVKHSTTGFALAINRNAVLQPPLRKEQLNADSIVVVEDSILNNDYWLGDSLYPFMLYGAGIDIRRIIGLQGVYHFPYNYGGTLFKWAYKMPGLHEQVFPFDVNALHAIPDAVLYSWLQHYTNIFCVGYDKQANWHDRTLVFKKNILVEKIRRNLPVSVYRVSTINTATLNPADGILLPYPDVEYCEYRCDQRRECQGFIYMKQRSKGYEKASCYLYTATTPTHNIPCDSCQRYHKTA